MSDHYDPLILGSLQFYINVVLVLLLPVNKWIHFFIRAVFNFVEIKFAVALVLHCYALWLVKKISRHFLNQSEVKPKPIVTCSHAFSRTWRRLHVFALSSDWFIGLSTSVVIGQSDYFGFGFTTLNWKLLYMKVEILPKIFAAGFPYKHCICSIFALTTYDSHQRKVLYLRPCYSPNYGHKIQVLWRSLLTFHPFVLNNSFSFLLL